MITDIKDTNARRRRNELRNREHGPHRGSVEWPGGGKTHPGSSEASPQESSVTFDASTCPKRSPAEQQSGSMEVRAWSWMRQQNAAEMMVLKWACEWARRSRVKNERQLIQLKKREQYPGRYGHILTKTKNHSIRLGREFEAHRKPPRWARRKEGTTSPGRSHLSRCHGKWRLQAPTPGNITRIYHKDRELRGTKHSEKERCL